MTIFLHFRDWLYIYYSCTILKEHFKEIQTSDFRMTTTLLYGKLLIFFKNVDVRNQNLNE